MIPNLKPSTRCAKTAKKAMGILGALKRSFLYFDEELFGRVFGTFVRPILEYCIQAWCPWMNKDYAMLKKPQRMATKLVTNHLTASICK
ncbi:unnamed protein product [Dibothriocephalus latus]|uniref:Uncharacterized protein n=1 Tax=Dibothriocephalus latus TaxID=60516 RepID=A0A3P7LIS7_DIBLA|nr:unnamed protein product [Dibothriocephalus latus]